MMTAADETTAAYKMIATRCAVCRLSLKDSLSVELGIGPECRKKYQFDAVVSPAARARANELILKIACGADDIATIMIASDELQELGFQKLHEVLIKRNAKITVSADGDRLLVKTPYNEDAAYQLRRLGGVAKYNEASRFLGYSIPADKRNHAWFVIRQLFVGLMGIGPKGVFVVSPLSAGGAA